MGSNYEGLLLKGSRLFIKTKLADFNISCRQKHLKISEWLNDWNVNGLLSVCSSSGLNSDYRYRSQVRLVLFLFNVDLPTQKNENTNVSSDPNMQFFLETWIWFKAVKFSVYVAVLCHRSSKCFFSPCNDFIRGMQME
jgi:hypothetical protein